IHLPPFDRCQRRHSTARASRAWTATRFQVVRLRVSGVRAWHLFASVRANTDLDERSPIMTTIQESGNAAWVRRRLIFGVVALISMAGVPAASAQSVSSGTIEGIVKDESNAILPGVT